METSVSLLSCRGGTANLCTNQRASLEVNADSEGNFQLTLDFLLQLRVVRGVQGHRADSLRICSTKLKG